MAGFLYIVGEHWDAPVKIGVAVDVGRRLRALQQASSVKLSCLWQMGPVDHPFNLETAAHAAFAKYRLLGEWFRIESLSPPEIIRTIESISTGGSTSAREREDTSVSCAAAVRLLIAAERKATLCSVEDAIDRVAASTGLSHNTIWAFRYRPPVDLYMTAYLAIARALWRLAGRPEFAVRDAPHPAEIAALVRETEAALGSAVEPEGEVK